MMGSKASMSVSVMVDPEMASRTPVMAAMFPATTSSTGILSAPTATETSWTLYVLGMPTMLTDMPRRSVPL